MSELTPNLKLFKYNTETDAKQPFSINDCMNANWDKIDASLGSLEICDIGMSLYVDESKGKRRYLNGQIVDRNANTEAFFKRLQDITTLHSSLLCTEEEWQSAKIMSAFGQVGKFVFNYRGDDIVSVRIPRVVNVQGLFDLQNLGMTIEAGLPNFKGTFNTDYARNTGHITSEAVTVAGGLSGSSTTNEDIKVTIDLSNASKVYRDDITTVQQEQIQYPYFIQIATGSETEANITNKFENTNPQTLLESKYSDKPLYNESWLLSNGQYNAKDVYPTVYEALQVEYNTEIEVGTTVTLPSGISYTKRGLSVKLSTETYTDYDFVLNTEDETFRLPLLNGSEDLFSSRIETLEIQSNPQSFIAPANGWFQANAKTTTANGYIYFGGGDSTASLNKITYTNPTNYKVYNTVFVNKGERVTIGAGGATLYSVRFYYAQGNGSLYFYVGDIDQNHGIVNMGRIGEQLVGKVDVSNTQWATNACMPDYDNGIAIGAANKYEALVDGY